MYFVDSSDSAVIVGTTIKQSSRFGLLVIVMYNATSVLRLFVDKGR